MTKIEKQYREVEEFVKNSQNDILELEVGESITLSYIPQPRRPLVGENYTVLTYNSYQTYINYDHRWTTGLYCPKGQTYKFETIEQGGLRSMSVYKITRIS